MARKFKYFIDFSLKFKFVNSIRCLNFRAKNTYTVHVKSELTRLNFWTKVGLLPQCDKTRFLSRNFFCSDGIMSRGQNILMGWLIPMIIVMFNLCFEYDNYGGEYHCWLQMNTSLIYGQFVPIAFMTITSLAIIGNVQL